WWGARLAVCSPRGGRGEGVALSPRLSGLAPDPAEADRPPQLPAERALPARQIERLPEAALGLRGVSRPDEDVALDPEHLRHVEGFAMIWNLRNGLIDRAQGLV